ncbi:helix-turn-helix transcriptional regulator [Novosphingobium sp. ST904]|uniref:helix-turn-helix domain-containing protein n=1 Tax=Novosphingobium sp. ST904 TaxID=1684385 RepID=UPI0006C841E2|nr:helix-turn-helix transcriptional regulator [Novosphingobium sp. ST904]KPH67137.1 hypothetical protein ADT71_02770 [Novosphingobium sp. ST904]TCM24922.1 helix-turn-helix protein [Novosphingobium sp. ST904]
MAFRADLLRKKLKDENRTQKFLAGELKTTQRTVSRWLSGANAPKGKDLERIANVLNCDAREFDPSHADEGAGILVSARVSVASHNAYEVMGHRYGVSQKAIVELAPILFSIVAARALNIPGEDLLLHDEATRRGLTSPLLGDNYQDQSGFEMDRRAASNGLCFGLKAGNPLEENPRNLFVEAMHRLTFGLADTVNLDGLVTTEAGEVPTASGSVVDVDVLRSMTGDSPELMQALASGQLRLSKCMDEFRAGGSDKVESLAAILQRHLEADTAVHRTALEARREASLGKLAAWHAAYAQDYPEMSAEYDELMQAYCHEAGWCPDWFTDDQKDELWADPFGERRFIDEDILPSFLLVRTSSALTMPQITSIKNRIRKIEAHRSTSKAAFEEAGE